MVATNQHTKTNSYAPSKSQSHLPEFVFVLVCLVGWFCFDLRQAPILTKAPCLPKKMKAKNLLAEFQQVSVSCAGNEKGTLKFFQHSILLYKV